MLRALVSLNGLPGASSCSGARLLSSSATLLGHYPLATRSFASGRPGADMGESASQDSASAGAAASGRPGAGDASSGPPTVLVFGGRGFVGSAVCREALNTGLQVSSVSPSGTPPLASEPWVSSVSWLRGNALEPQSYRHLLQGAAAVISCVGAFGSQEHMMKVNGTANAQLAEAAKAAGVGRFVYISAHIPDLPGFGVAARGYVEGKRTAEDAVRKTFPQTGVILRPWAIYGQRQVTSSVSVPLQLIFKPLESALSLLPGRRRLADTPLVGSLLLPPVSVDAVARAAVAAATDPSVPGGVLDVWDIQARYGN